MSELLERIKRKHLVARLYRAMHPSNSTCGCCGLPWAVAKPHHVDMIEPTDESCGGGFFSVCEWCWKNKSWNEISNSVVDLHLYWQRDGLKHNYAPPYKLTDMLAKTQQDYENEKQGE